MQGYTDEAGRWQVLSTRDGVVVSAVLIEPTEAWEQKRVESQPAPDTREPRLTDEEIKAIRALIAERATR